MQTAQQLADKAMSEYFMQHNYRAMYEYYQTHIRSMLSQQQQQREWISVLEKKEFCLWDDEEVTMLTREEHQAIIALLSQKQQQRSYSEEDMYEAYKAEHPLRIYDSMKRQLFNKWLTKYLNE